MIKCEVIEEFTLEKYDKLVDIERKSIEQKGKLFVGDKFRCDEDMVKYLTGENDQKKVVVKVIEVEPYEAKVFDTDKVEVKTDKPKKKKTSKK